MVMDDRNRPLYMISVASGACGSASPDAARVRAERPRHAAANERQHPHVLAGRHRALGLINELTNEGINLAGVTRILDLQGRLDARDEEIDDLHKRVRRLADRVHELETRESVNSLVQNDVGGVTPGAIVLRRLS